MAMEGSTSRSPPTSARRESSSCSTWEGSLLFPTSGEEGEKLGALCVRDSWCGGSLSCMYVHTQCGTVHVQCTYLLAEAAHQYQIVEVS